MKKSIITLLTTIVAISMVFSASAQQSNRLFNTVQSYEIKAMGDLLTSSSPGNTVSQVLPARTLKNFTCNYVPAGATQWYQTAKGFLAEFNADSIKYSIWYDNKGRWSGSIKSYHEKKLPPDIRRMIKTKYYDYGITFIREIATQQSNAGPVYVVTLEDEKSYKLICASEEDMYEMNELVKAK